MNSIVIALIWAAVIAGLGWLAIHTCYKLVSRLVAIKHRAQAVADREQAADLELAAATVAERAAHEKARLRKEAALMASEAAVQEDPKVRQAKIDERVRVIAARAEGKALAAKEAAISEDSSDAKIVDTIMKTYERSGRMWTFNAWFGDRDLRDFKAKR